MRVSLTLMGVHKLAVRSSHSQSYREVNRLCDLEEVPSRQSSAKRKVKDEDVVSKRIKKSNEDTNAESREEAGHSKLLREKRLREELYDRISTYKSP